MPRRLAICMTSIAIACIAGCAEPNGPGCTMTDPTVKVQAGPFDTIATSPGVAIPPKP